MDLRIEWTIRAQRHLRRALAGKICRTLRAEHGDQLRSSGGSVLETEMRNLDELLQRTFQGRSITVQDHMLGYRTKEDVFILLVEVFADDQPGSYVVKVGREKAIRDEVQAWNLCRPVGMLHDLVFLPLRIGCEEPVGDPPWLSLVYGDAHQFLGVETIATFEEAALGAILHDEPSVTSVGLVVWQLYERIGHLLYGHSFEERPEGRQEHTGCSEAGRFVLDVPHLHASLPLWGKDPLLNLRKKVNLIVPHGTGELLDPVDYLQYVNHFVPFRDGDNDAVGGEAASGGGSAPKTPRPEDVVPSMLRGCAHGDLHGRNLLVGLVRGKALWPTLFDYEDMGPCNLLGWDFVKLETELKVRAYPGVFFGTQSQFIESVHTFERGLDTETESRYRGDSPWTGVRGSESPEERLKQLLLEIRHRAALHLGIERRRPNRWLEEYYFLLSCYGICTARFPNLQPKEQLAAFLSAGTAAARLSWPRTIHRET